MSLVTSKIVSPVVVPMIVPSALETCKFLLKVIHVSHVTKITVTFAQIIMSALHAPMDSNLLRINLNVLIVLFLAVATALLIIPALNAYLDLPFPMELAAFVVLLVQHVKVMELAKLVSFPSHPMLIVMASALLVLSRIVRHVVQLQLLHVKLVWTHIQKIVETFVS